MLTKQFINNQKFFLHIFKTYPFNPFKINNYNFSFHTTKNFSPLAFQTKNLSCKFLSFKTYQAFSTSQNPYNPSGNTPKQQFAKNFVVKIYYLHSEDAYYQTYPFREQFRKQIQKLQQSNQCYIIGGDQFPLQTSQFFINCENKQFISNWLSKVFFFYYKNIEHLQHKQIDKLLVNIRNGKNIIVKHQKVDIFLSISMKKRIFIRKKKEICIYVNS